MKKGISTILSVIAGAVAAGIAVNHLQSAKHRGEEVRTEKYRGYYFILNRWLLLKHQGKTMVDYFYKNNYHTIAIYGMGEIGNRLTEELQESGILIKYGIDRSVNAVMDTEIASVKMYSVEQSLPPVDVIVVTASFAFDEIEKLLSGKVSCPIVSIDSIVMGI